MLGALWAEDEVVRGLVVGARQSYCLAHILLGRMLSSISLGGKTNPMVQSPSAKRLVI
jgi:hypothetical protein